MTNTTNQELQDHVNHIAKLINDGDWANGEEYEEGNEPTAYDWLEDVLDIEWVVGSEKDLRGCRLLVAFGGPNIWVDTRRGIVEGHWYSDSATAHFNDNYELDDCLADLYHATMC